MHICEAGAGVKRRRVTLAERSPLWETGFGGTEDVDGFPLTCAMRMNKRIDSCAPLQSVCRSKLAIARLILETVE